MSVWNRVVDETVSLETVATGSRVWRVLRSAAALGPGAATRRSLRRSRRSSTVAAVARAARRTARRSALVRWVTAEPDPSVVVVDLRETVTVGPALAVLDRTLAPLERAADAASAPAALDRVADAVGEAPVRVASALLLGVVVGRLAADWPTVSDWHLATAAFLAAPALLGLRVAASWTELADGPLGRAVRAVLEPPDAPPDESR